LSLALIAAGSTALVLLCLFLWVHTRPLNLREIADLAARRRVKAIEAYFRFERPAALPDADIKRTMPAKGGWVTFNCPLELWPSTAAALFKYKKHEWVIVAFVHGRHITRLWINKGSDSVSVELPLGPQSLLEECRRGGYSSVFFHHNHPNPSPREFYMLVPSSQDKSFAERYAAVLHHGGVNTFQFVCERGRFHCFHSMVADTFMPISQFLGLVARQNGVSRRANLALHTERLFGWAWKLGC
jgi:hypothetical protein